MARQPATEESRHRRAARMAPGLAGLGLIGLTLLVPSGCKRSAGVDDDIKREPTTLKTFDDPDRKIGWDLVGRAVYGNWYKKKF